MHNLGTEHKKWDSGVRKIQVKKSYCFMTDTPEQMTPVYIGLIQSFLWTPLNCFSKLYPFWKIFLFISM